MQHPIIYLDNNATTRTDDRVVQAMLPFFTSEYANSGSAHLFGLSANEAVDDARLQVAEFINSKPNEIVFTSGATEAINLVLKGFPNQNRKHIVTVNSEHKGVLDTCRFLESDFDVTYLNVDEKGEISLGQLENAITENTFLVSVMFANNEIGNLNPIKEMVKIAREKGALFMTDATQAVGKIPVDVKDLDVDFLVFSAHKFYGPKGIGALYISSDNKKKPHALIHGGGQQRNRRSGTLNVPGIVAMGKACEIAQSEMGGNAVHIGKLRDMLEKGLLEIDGAFVNGTIENRLFNTTNICFPGIDSDKLILQLQNIAVSNGSACSAVSTEPSHVLKAIGLSDENALASIRFSLGKYNTSREIDTTIERVKILVSELRK
ncbi:MAG: cysteine desulfurase [Flavobacterium sp.]|uniref:cysteine desulfurase family protein n=1 Tax=Flavobacterium sp. TaxID=239 RepID=UPI0011F5AEE1|nr:cysteine desulfurase family protein [Flavobacterium sp.]RZJ64268.1 MAG: cysteine desulfurase [Flavobacterium sp.]